MFKIQLIVICCFHLKHQRPHGEVFNKRGFSFLFPCVQFPSICSAVSNNNSIMGACAITWRDYCHCEQVLASPSGVEIEKKSRHVRTFVDAPFTLLHNLKLYF